MRDIDRVIELVGAALPALKWDRGDLLNPAQETGRWGFTLTTAFGKVHARSVTGMCPFVVETTQEGAAASCSSIQETADAVIARLGALRKRTVWAGGNVTTPAKELEAAIRAGQVTERKAEPAKSPWLPGRKPKPQAELFKIEDPHEFWQQFGLYLDNVSLNRAPNSMEREIDAIQILEGQVSNGGLHQYFFNSTGDQARDALKGLERVGAVKMADLLRRAMAVFPKGTPSPKREVRWKQMEKLGEKGEDLWHRLGSELSDYPDDLPTLIASYVRSHRNTLGPEPPPAR